MAQSKDISGLRFGRLTALNRTKKDKFGISVWSCYCDCGKNVEVRLCSLTSSSTRSCGCLNNEVRSASATGNKYAHTHGLSKHYLYQTWATMKQRCSNPKHAKYPYYGGRGISVSKSWKDSFTSFIEDMGDRPDGYSLSRIDNDGDYCKENCKWETYSDQNRNRRPYKRNKASGLFNEM